jgi:hypothetical protein
MGVMATHSIADSAFYDPGRSDGENIARLASGLQKRWSDTHGDGGKAAGFRLVQAGFHFRTALMGIRLAEAAGTPSGTQLKLLLGEREDQLLAFSGAKEAVTALVSTLDLAAAAVYKLNYGAPFADPNRERDVEDFPPDSKLRSPVPTKERAWLNGVRGVNEKRRLWKLRDMFTHQYFPRDLAILAVFDQRVDLDRPGERLGDLVQEFRGFVVDRLVALSLIY